MPGPRRESEMQWYPTRLIDLGAIEESGKPGQRVNPEKVRFVMTEQGPPQKDDIYVKLSRCWGKAKFLRLKEKNLAQFRKEVRLDALPKTFQHAIRFSPGHQIQFTHRR